jgi:5'/3'-nucleotidase SurE
MGWAAKDIDLVISGPNHGPNASTIYNMSSETVGGALEGALCGKKSVSLSFASKDPQPQAITRAACDRAIGLIELLVASWHPEVEVYNVNIPMIESVADCPAEFAIPTRSHWKAAALFTETPSETPTKETLDSQTGKNGSNNTRYFKWRPDLTDVEAATSSSRPGEDLWVSTNDMIS